MQIIHATVIHKQRTHSSLVLHEKAAAMLHQELSRVSTLAVTQSVEVNWFICEMKRYLRSGYD